MADKKEFLGKVDLLYLVTLISGELSKYVKAVEGKGLSSNDYTTTEKTKLANIAENATSVNETTVSGWGFTKNTGTITGVTMNGASKGTSGIVDLGTVITEHQDISGKVDKITGKGLSTNDFTTALLNKLNGIDLSIYSTTEQMNQAINAAIAGVTGIKFVKVASYSDLPAVGAVGTIYLVPNQGTAPNVQDEYFWDADAQKYELFGTTEIDLTNYLKSSDVVELETTEIQAIWDSIFTD